MVFGIVLYVVNVLLSVLKALTRRWTLPCYEELHCNMDILIRVLLHRVLARQILVAVGDLVLIQMLGFKSFESYFNQLVRKQEEKKWIEENSKAIETFNKRVEETGVFSDGLKSF